MSSGLTHINVSYMSLGEKEQREITSSGNALTFEGLKDIYKSAWEHGVQLRINNNVFRGNNDTLNTMVNFYNVVKPFCNSIKFSPLLKTDSFSVVDAKSKWVCENILSDDEYDKLFSELENFYRVRYGISVITNNETFGFVKNSIIPLLKPIILNWNQHGQMMNKVVKESKINNIKLLPNNELSLSWNRESSEYFLKTN